MVRGQVSVRRMPGRSLPQQVVPDPGAARMDWPRAAAARRARPCGAVGKCGRLPATVSVSTTRPAPLGAKHLVTQGGDACPVCDAPAVRRIDVEAFALYHCPACGAWSSDALARGAATSFEPSSYFDNPELDRDKWDRLVSRLERAGAPFGAALDVGCGTGDFLAYLAARHPGIRCEGIEL